MAVNFHSFSLANVEARLQEAYSWLGTIQNNVSTLDELPQGKLTELTQTEAFQTPRSNEEEYFKTLKFLRKEAKDSDRVWQVWKRRLENTELSEDAKIVL